MATPKAPINLTALDQDELKASLVAFLKTKPEFSGFNFEGSSINMILDVLSYNSSFNAYYAHMVANEMFLDSATDSRSVTSHAKNLGYTRGSRSAAQATLRVITTSTASSPTILPRGSKFTVTVDARTSVSFTTVDDYVIPVGSGIVNDIKVVEGVLTTVSYTLPAESAADVVYGNGEIRLTIPDKKVDTKTLKVLLYTSDLQKSYEFVNATHVADATNNGLVYFVQENTSGFYNVVFNRALQTLSTNAIPDSLTVARIDYVATSGASANAAFSGPGSTNIKVTFPSVGGVTMTFDGFVEFPFGGTDAETDESVKFLAPRLYTAQNRAVTPSDYKALISHEISGIETIRVVGGETLNPPAYGRILISLKYKNRLTTPVSVKEAINELVTTKGMITAVPLFVEPDYTYISPSLSVKFSAQTTNVSPGVISALVTTAVIDYGNTTLARFDADLWNSQFLDAIQSADASIISVSANYSLKKKFEVFTNTANTVALHFGNPIKPGTMTSSNFLVYDAITGKNQTAYMVDDSAGDISLVWYNGSSARFIQKIGTVDYATGEVSIRDFNPLDVVGGVITVQFASNTDDITADGSQILVFDISTIAVSSTPVRP